MKVGLVRLLPEGESCMILRSLVLTHYQRVTDRQMDGLTDWWIPRLWLKWRSITQMSTTKQTEGHEKLARHREPNSGLCK